MKKIVLQLSTLIFVLAMASCSSPTEGDDVAPTPIEEVTEEATEVEAEAMEVEDDENNDVVDDDMEGDLEETDSEEVDDDDQPVEMKKAESSGDIGIDDEGVDK